MSYTSGQFAAHAQQVLQDDHDGTPENTTRAYKPKANKWVAYCDHTCGADHNILAHVSKYLVTEEKFFGFLFYQSRRSKRPAGKQVLFCTIEYNDVMANAEAIATEPRIGWSAMNQYRCSILKIYQGQLDNNANNLTKQHLLSNRVMKLLNNVKMRQKHIAKQNFEEKLTSEFAPYAAVNELPQIESYLFEKNKLKSTYSFASLRDRYCLLMTTQAILRGESLFKCDLSDLMSIIYRPEGSCQDISVYVMRIATGKANGLKTLYGRCVCARDVTLCAAGALGLHLLARFDITDEGPDMDFTEKAKWFNTKLLMDCRR